MGWRQLFKIHSFTHSKFKLKRMYEPRTYRKKMGEGRFSSFTASYKDTDLWIGINSGSMKKEIKQFVDENIQEVRKQIEYYINLVPDFQTSLKPLSFDDTAPEIVKKMFDAGQKAGIGPMGAVAGAVSQQIGEMIINEFDVKELVIENGGDLFLKITEPMTISVFAGESPLSEKIGVKVLPEYSPLGVCTSSGTVGHSFSYGKADAVMIACKNTAQADAYATGFCNKIKTETDVQHVVEETQKHDEILSVVAICNDKMAIRGEFEMEIL